MAVTMRHGGQILHAVERWDINAKNCRYTGERKSFERLWEFDKIRLYRFHATLPIFGYITVDYDGTLSPVFKIAPRDLDQWEKWQNERDIVDPQGAGAVLGSHHLTPFMLGMRLVR